MSVLDQKQPESSYVEDTGDNQKDCSQTIDDVTPQYGIKWYKQSHLVKLNFLLLICMFSSTNNGYDGSLLNALYTYNIWKEDFGNPQGAKLGGISNAMMFGGVLAWPIVPYLSDKYGRRIPIGIGCLLIIVGAVIGASSHNYVSF